VSLVFCLVVALVSCILRDALGTSPVCDESTNIDDSTEAGDRLNVECENGKPRERIELINKCIKK